MSPPAWVRAVLLLGIALAGVAAPGVGRAQPADAARQAFALPAGRLEDALNGFARQAGITLSFDPGLVRDRRAPALGDRLTVAEGLTALLAPHGLEAVRGDGGAWVIRHAAHAGARTPAAGELATVTVTAASESERADGPIQGYVAQRSATATGTDTALAETPRALTAVSREQMDDQAVQTVEQSLRYAAGVLTEAGGYDRRFPSPLAVRGQAPAEFLDGLGLSATNVKWGSLVEPQGLERVELLKGPGIVYHDQEAPGGGVVHMISKRPRADAPRELGISIGSHGRRQLHVDVGGAWDGSEEWLFRLNGLLRDSRGQTDFSRDDRFFLAPALSWTPTSRTTATLIATATRDRVSPTSTWPEHALITPNPNGRIPVSRFVGEPGVDGYRRELASLTWLLAHRIDDRWTLRQSARHAAMHFDDVEVYGVAFREDRRTLDRHVMHWRGRDRATLLDHQVEGRFSTGAFAHTLLIGADVRRHVHRTASGDAPAPPIDAFAPAYGAPVDVPGTQSWGGSYGMGQSGIYLQDQVRAGRWVLGLAMRRDGASSDQVVPLGSNGRRNSYNAGLLYRAPAGLTPYASYSTSFNPMAYGGLFGDSLKAELGRQVEAGLKYTPAADALLTLSAFELRRRNAFAWSPVESIAAASIGEVRLRGLEFEARAAPTRRLKVLASLSLLDPRITDSSNPRQLGRQPFNTARRTAALWLDHRFGGLPGQGWSLGAGVRHVGRVPASADNSRFNPAYTAVDVALRCEHGAHGFALNVTNLFDRVHVGGFGQYHGQGRTVQLKTSYRW